ncbi:sucrose phosphorylase [Halobacillus andaensis]|uniref:Sucrose phosphorylase n=1 Tax=Halobacillus andaensis TaxID=1176239 RepID=A0A917EXB4_HALAA|nr:alpha-amylase family glycosyl hydrolase [Halobacillus andaensis]MBP2005308.1 sucrose phosphorylase [Halobacillus andaensis]GGF30503.1 sucrose phosphorylase [Halobacillus andaensis]
MKLLDQIKEHLEKIYGGVSDKDVRPFEQLITRWEKEDWQAAKTPTEKNVYLISYGDSIYRKNEPTLPVLHQFLKEEVGDTITDVHLLPMFPYTSDDGFSVTDYRAINPELGSWSDIRSFSNDFQMMFDFVANHMSKSSEWFQEYLNDHPEYRHYFIPKDEQFDSSRVVRPRTSPLFHEYRGGKTAWTTFSEDQVDVNFKHIPVLVEMTDILLEYAHQGAASIRLDAIGFIWKKSGTTSIHLEEAHEIIRLWHTVINAFKPNTQLITETNVPHQENISYFGDGTNEANMVYQFSLPPLVLYSLMTHKADKLTEWAKSIEKVSDSATYFNFLASHDGIGMRRTEGILTDEERQQLVEQVKRNGGEVSYKRNPDGSQSVYELNINYSEALVNKGEDLTEMDGVKKMLAAHSILLSVIGVPAIYYHSLLGSKNDRNGYEVSGIPRRINREKLEFDRIKQELHENERRSAIFHGLKEMINLRQQESAFSPYAVQEVMEIDPRIFALKRVNDRTGDEVFFAVNTSRDDVSFDLPYHGTKLWGPVGNSEPITLGAYDFIWLKR